MSTTVYDKNGQPYEADLVDGDSFRKLQRELAEAKEAITGLRGLDMQNESIIAQLRAQLAEARAEVERLKAEGDKDWRDARAQAIENDQLRAQLAEAHAEMERLKSKHEGISSINSRYREVVEHCKDPNGGPLAVAPEMVMKYVDQLRARVAQLESRLRNPVVETIEHQQGGVTT